MTDNIYQTSPSAAQNTTAGQGGFVSVGMEPFGAYATPTANSGLFSGTANQLRCYQFTLTKTVTVNKVFAVIGTTVASANLLYVCLYDVNKNLLLQANFDTTTAGNLTATSVASGTTQIVSGAGITLQPGVYWFCVACSATTVTTTVSTPPFAGNVNIVALQSGSAANLVGSVTTKVAPATLGAISSLSSNVMFAFFSP